jgi:hypothetical protein
MPGHFSSQSFKKQYLKIAKCCCKGFTRGNMSKPAIDIIRDYNLNSPLKSRKRDSEKAKGTSLPDILLNLITGRRVSKWGHKN